MEHMNLNSLVLLSPAAMAQVFAGIGVLTVANYAANHAVRRHIPRLVYTVLVVFLCGTLVPAFALRACSQRINSPRQPSAPPPHPWPLRSSSAALSCSERCGARSRGNGAACRSYLSPCLHRVSRRC